MRAPCLMVPLFAGASLGPIALSLGDSARSTDELLNLDASDAATVSQVRECVRRLLLMTGPARFSWCLSCVGGLLSADCCFHVCDRR